MDDIDVVKELELLIKEGKEKVLSAKYDNKSIVAPSMVDKNAYAVWYTKGVIMLKSFLKEDDPSLYSLRT